MRGREGHRRTWRLNEETDDEDEDDEDGMGSSMLEGHFKHFAQRPRKEYIRRILTEKSGKARRTTFGYGMNVTP